tara:strand:+ start:376 stop:588 length:213 start_codon:yes stop_codon:yes gene_type:complete
MKKIKLIILFIFLYGCSKNEIEIDSPSLELSKIKIDTEGFVEINSKEEYFNGIFEFSSVDYEFEDPKSFI